MTAPLSPHPAALPPDMPEAPAARRPPMGVLLCILVVLVGFIAMLVLLIGNGLIP
jgi:hypothetical protein